jgi:hypothetical protein
MAKRSRSMSVVSRNERNKDTIEPLTPKATSGKQAESKSEPPIDDSPLIGLKYLLASPVQVAISSARKKKPSYDNYEVRLFHTQLVLQGKKTTIIPLNSLCLLQREDLIVQLKGSKSPSAPSLIRSVKSKEGPDRTLLLCTHELSRVWLRFESVAQMELWILSIDGLLSTSYSSSLIEPAQKV